MISISTIRSLKLYDMAVFDLLGTFAIVYLPLRYYNQSNTTIALTTLNIFQLSIIMHLMFRIDTQLTYVLGLSKKPYRGPTSFKFGPISIK